MSKEDKTKVKGSDQPPTKIGYDDKRTQKDKDAAKKNGTTDQIMERQAQDHEVQRT